jgi:Uma2 family endonuclease
MTQPVMRGATYEDLLRIPENLIAELIDGEIYTAPRPGSPHAVAASVLGSLLLPPFHLGHGGPGGWWILDEPELHLRRDAFVPDLGGWRRETTPVCPNTSGTDVAPDWLCEILSPGNAGYDRVKKVPKYARNGVEHVWIVDPIARTLEVYRLNGEHYLLVSTHEADERIRVEPFDAVELDLELLWLSA